MKKIKVACFGLGFDQKKLIKKLSKIYNVIGFDTNSEAPGIKYVQKHHNTPFNEQKKILNILKVIFLVQIIDVKQLFVQILENPIK